MNARIVGHVEDGKVVYNRIPDDCYKCHYCVGDQYTHWDCEVTGRIIGTGKRDFPVPDSCPFPTVEELALKIAEKLRALELPESVAGLIGDPA